ncbi:MAG: hypothetical protein J6J16_03120 [Lachnospiraceae bacterium]|nr:hypothetical protein [Lachnospiraceae bacterium]
MEKRLKVLTDPISNRIIQLIRVRGEMTIADIISANIGVPRATLYRKIDKMVEVGAIYVASTNKVRGQIEKVYKIKDIFVATKGSKEEDMQMITMSLMGILGQYENYFKKDSADVTRDKLFMFNYNISLSDEDFGQMMQEMYQLVDKYQKKQGKENAKLRNLYMLSAPGGEE